MEISLHKNELLCKMPLLSISCNILKIPISRTGSLGGIGSPGGTGTNTTVSWIPSGFFPWFSDFSDSKKNHNW